MFNRFTKEARDLVAAAEEEARVLGSPSIEAEHLLLAYAAEPGAGVVAHGDLLDALEEQFLASLRVAGVDPETIERAPLPELERRPRFGVSSKKALEGAYRLAKARGDRRIEPRHVALSVLEARRGTVPRTLRAAGLEAEDLRARI